MKTKFNLNCQNECFGKLFLKSGNTSVYFFMFSLLRFIWQTIDVSLIVFVKGLCFYHYSTTVQLNKTKSIKLITQVFKVGIANNKNKFALDVPVKSLTLPSELPIPGRLLKTWYIKISKNWSWWIKFPLLMSTWFQY